MNLIFLEKRFEIGCLSQINKLTEIRKTLHNPYFNSHWLTRKYIKGRKLHQPTIWYCFEIYKLDYISNDAHSMNDFLQATNSWITILLAFEK